MVMGPASLSDAELAVRLRRLVAIVGDIDDADPLIIEAACRLERAAIAAGTCKVYTTDRAHTKFVQRQPLCPFVDPDADASAIEIKTMDIFLERGEHRAVDLWGEIMIVYRPAR